MNKKKVVELLKEALDYLNTTPLDVKTRVLCSDRAFRHIEEAIKELNKSDWNSVEEELPPYGEEVFVISKKGYKNVSYRRKINKKNFNPNLIDKNDFILNFNLLSDEITHWCKIDKLEV